MTLKIEVGKFYRTRDGRKVGPMVPWQGDYPFTAWLDDGAQLWSDIGSRAFCSWHSSDLIAEWTDEPAATDDDSDGLAYQRQNVPAETDKPHMTLLNGDKLFEGDYGVTRGGDVVGPMQYDDYADIKFAWGSNQESYTKYGFYMENDCPYPLDIIAKHHPAATTEVGTLRELNVKPGDVVEWAKVYPGKHLIVSDPEIKTHGEYYGEVEATLIGYGRGIFGDEKFRVISRAKPETPDVAKSMHEAIFGAPEQDLPFGHARLPSGEVVDLTAITAPFGLLPPDVQQALRDHGGPWENYCGLGWANSDPQWYQWSAYRVRPQPHAQKVEEVVLYGRHDVQWVFDRSTMDTHRITFNLIDGKPDTSSIRMEAL